MLRRVKIFFTINLIWISTSIKKARWLCLEMKVKPFCFFHSTGFFYGLFFLSVDEQLCQGDPNVAAVLAAASGMIPRLARKACEQNALNQFITSLTASGNKKRFFLQKRISFLFFYLQIAARIRWTLRFLNMLASWTEKKNIWRLRRFILVLLISKTVFDVCWTLNVIGKLSFETFWIEIWSWTHLFIFLQRRRSCRSSSLAADGWFVHWSARFLGFEICQGSVFRSSR